MNNGKHKQSALQKFAKQLLESGVVVAEPSVEQQIQKLVIDNPQMSISTFLNTLKSMGLKIDKSVSETNVTPKKSEADSSTGFPQTTRESIGFKVANFTLKESADKPRDPTIGFTKFGSILLQEGLGNLGSAYFYTKESLKSAVQIFEGKKNFADHPTLFEEENRPERSVRDVLGYFKSMQYMETESGRGQLIGDLTIPPTQPFEWARSLMTMAVQYSKEFPDKDFVGLSINASGDAVETPIKTMIEAASCPEVKAKLIEAQEAGITEVKVVYKFDDAVSCDLVTEAGAAGRIKTLMEGDKSMSKKKTQKEAGDPSQGGGHADADQDAGLIKKMISKYMGGDGKAEPSEEECGIVKEAYEACKEMGMDEAKSEEAAVHSLKMSKHMAQKQAQKEADDKAKQEADDADAKAKKEADDKAAADEKAKSEPKESAKALAAKDEEIKTLKESNTELQGKVTALESKLGQYDIQNHVEKICKESGLKMEATKKFREAVKDIKSVGEVDKTWKTWKSAFDAVNDTVVVHSFAESVAVNAEKQSSSSGGVDFASEISN